MYMYMYCICIVNAYIFPCSKFDPNGAVLGPRRGAAPQAPWTQTTSGGLEHVLFFHGPTVIYIYIWVFIWF